MTSCWIVTEGLTGTENQCLGVAEALGVIPVVKRIGLRQPWKTLSPFLGGETTLSFTGDKLQAPWPDLLISSGRKSIAVARYIHRQSAGKTFIVQLQDPRIASPVFDLIAVPTHDRRRGGNVVITEATPNRITPQRLAEGRQDFSELLRSVPSPRVAVLIGGNSKSHKLTPAAMQTLATQLKELDRLGFGLMITTSRRTGEDNLALLKEALKDTQAFLWDGRGDNPYFGLLGWADYILVTADSASMISEAATTGKPVYVISLPGGSAKFNRLYNHLLQQGAIRLFEGPLQPYLYDPLQDAALIAAEIRRKMGNPERNPA